MAEPSFDQTLIVSWKKSRSRTDGRWYPTAGPFLTLHDKTVHPSTRIKKALAIALRQKRHELRKSRLREEAAASAERFPTV